MTALVLVFMVSAMTGTLADNPWPFSLLCLLAAACSVPVSNPSLRYWRPLVEGAIAALLISTSDPYDPSLLPYLVVPSLVAGLTGGWSLAVITSGCTGLALMSRALVVADGLAGSEYLVDVTQWTLLALGLGLLAAWLRRLQTQRPSDDQSYGEATKLLIQLREISRELSGGLDVVSISGGLLAQIRDDGLADRGWVFSYRQGGLPVLLVADPSNSPTLDPSLESGSLWANAIETLRPQFGLPSLTEDASMSPALVPVHHHETVIALVAVERRRRWSVEDLSALERRSAADAIRLDAAMLFDEVRTLATSEERQRLAREIHDGVAQEVASLGYLIDDLTADAPEHEKVQLQRLRSELSRIVTELRFSIFDLRRELGPGVSLTSALAEHARHVGETAGFTVHLELSETPRRLRPQVESEIFRIAQEALTNIRKHARARNIWVACSVDAPSVSLMISDDGRGLLEPREDSFGLSIMRERADRVGCDLTVRERKGGGTTVTVTSASDPHKPDSAQARVEKVAP